jgi:hypothetical protein
MVWTLRAFVILLNSCATAWISQQELSDPPALDPNFYMKNIKRQPRIGVRLQGPTDLKELSPGGKLRKKNQIHSKLNSNLDLSKQESPASLFAAAAHLHHNSPDEANSTANARSRPRTLLIHAPAPFLTLAFHPPNPVI